MFIYYKTLTTYEACKRLRFFTTSIKLIAKALTRTLFFNDNRRKQTSQVVLIIKHL